MSHMPQQIFFDTHASRFVHSQSKRKLSVLQRAHMVPTDRIARQNRANATSLVVLVISKQVHLIAIIIGTVLENVAMEPCKSSHPMNEQMSFFRSMLSQQFVRNFTFSHTHIAISFVKIASKSSQRL